MSYTKAQLTVPQREDANGNPASGYTISSYIWDTSTPTPMYTSSAGAGSATSFTLNSLGEPQTAGGTACDIFLDTSVTYKIIIRDAGGVQVGPTVGPVKPSDGTATTITFLQSGTGAVEREANAKMGEELSVADFGAVGNSNGTAGNGADDTLAITAAIAALTDGATLHLERGKTYRVTSTLAFPRLLKGVVLQGNGSTIFADHTGDGIDATCENQNYSRHKFYNLTIKGPNVSYPNNPTELVGTSTGAGLRLGYNDTSNTVGGYLCGFYNCIFTNFYQGVYLQATILCTFYGGYIAFNQYGVYADGGQTNANTFFGTGIRENRLFGVYSSGRAGGDLTRSTHNVFYGCEIETNIPYDASNGGYPAAFDDTRGHGVKLWDSYAWVFNGCYFENHNYSVLLETSSDDNHFVNCRFDGGGAGGVRPGSFIIGGATCNNNVLQSCKMNDYVGYAAGTYQVLSSTSFNNQVLDCIGFSFNPANILSWPHIRNLRKAQGTAGSGQYFGALVIPSQGQLHNPEEGTAQGRIEGVGTASATLNAFGYSHFVFGNQITGNTTIDEISNMRPGQFLVLTNYQVAYTVTIKSSTSGTGTILLKNYQNVVLTDYGQTLTLFCNNLGQVVEVGRSMADAATFTWTPTANSFTVVGTPTYSGRYSIIGSMLFFEISISVSGGTTSSTANASYFSNLPATPVFRSACAATSVNVANFGNGLVNTGGGGIIATPTWAATADTVIVSGSYRIA